MLQLAMLLVIFSRFTNELLAPSVSDAHFPGARGIPSVHESTVQARRVLQLNNIATLSTVFPPSSDTVSPRENRPADVAAAPFAMMEYYAQCGPEPYNPTILGVTISSTMRNSAAGSNVTLSLRYQPPPNAPPLSDPWAYIPANLPRFALVGNVERLPDDVVEEEGIQECFLKSHPEARIWEPSSDVHDSWWGRLVVKEFYFFGGFGDRAHIGWLPIEEWQGVTQEEVDMYRLVGEEGYKEAVDQRLEL